MSVSYTHLDVYKRQIYSGCQWSAIQEEGKVGAMVAEKVTLMATSRIEVAA